MRIVLRHAALLALAAAVSWWLCLGWPRERPQAVPPRPRPVPVALTPMLEEQVALAAPAPAAPPAFEPVAEQPPPRQEPAQPHPAPEPELPDLPDEFLEPAPPPPETGTPEGSEEGEVARSDPEPEPEPETPPEEVARAPEQPEPGPQPEPPSALEDEAASARELAALEAHEDEREREHEDEPRERARAPRDAGQLMADPELLAAARAELSGQERRGFGTVLLAAPEEQLDIARHFGEELVLIPRSVLDQERGDPRWYRVDAGGAGAVERVDGPPPLEGFRQYRDLFEYDYALLPEELRELRRRVPARSEVYLFAALIPPREWAAIIGRRREALQQSGRTLEEVRRFVLHYVRLPGGGFDILVEEIVFTDGERFRPADGRRGA